MAVVGRQRNGAILTITLNRPDALNALTEEVHRLLGAALDEALADEVRAVVITGAGRAFCAGQDLSEFDTLDQDVGEHLRRTYHPNVLAIRALEKPVIAALNGAAAGAGLSLACACDYRIAADSAALIPGFVGIGLVPDAGSTYALARLLGPSRAFTWMTTNRRLTAAEAHTWGLVDEVVEAGSVATRAAELASAYAAAPTRAVGLTKRLFDEAGSATLDEQLELEAKLQSIAAASDDFREGVSAFLEKRPPRFTGR